MKFNLKASRHLFLLGLTLLMAAGFLLMSFHYAAVSYHNFFTEKKITYDERYGPLNGEAPQRIILILQGTGMNPADIMPVANHMAPHFPDTIFIVPQAVFFGSRPGTRKWYVMFHKNETEFYAYGFDQAKDGLFSYIKNLHRETGIPYEKIGIIGFSQGGSMGLSAALDFPAPFWGVVSYAGILFAEKQNGRYFFVPVETSHTERRTGLDIPDEIQTPLLLFHGTNDRLVDPNHSRYAAEMLRTGTKRIDLFRMPEAGHEITPASLRKVTEFFESHE